jgi:hypothetical protein
MGNKNGRMLVLAKPARLKQPMFFVRATTGSHVPRAYKDVRSCAGATTGAQIFKQGERFGFAHIIFLVCRKIEGTCSPSTEPLPCLRLPPPISRPCCCNAASAVGAGEAIGRNSGKKCSAGTIEGKASPSLRPPRSARFASASSATPNCHGGQYPVYTLRVQSHGWRLARDISFQGRAAAGQREPKP